MSKLYIVGHRNFKTEKSMKNFLLRMSAERRARTKVEVYNLEKVENGDFIDQEMLSNSRDLQLKSILDGSELANIINTIKDKINTHLEKMKVNNRYYNGYEYNIILNKISIVNNEKELSDVVGTHGKILFKLEKSLDWYKTLLQSRSFQKIPNGYFSKTWDSNQRKYITQQDDEVIKIFNEAKKQVSLERKKKVKV